MQYKLAELPLLAKDTANKTKKFFAKLKKRPPKNLDLLVSEIHDTVFEDINCLDCANCCKTTSPLFLRQDIKRISSYLKLKPAAFEEQYLRIDEDNDWVLKQTPCSFLNQDNSCSIYDVRPKACSEFPHTNRKKIYQIAEITKKNVSICPAAHEIVEQMKATIAL